MTRISRNHHHHHHPD
ncbi:his operon leader peptide [Providencia stuartii]|nr:his operon leader peptide [Providencia stuartii]QET99747.1 his operon leader peptide [Providencia stuartii]RMA15208.1 his operon leader peptide [Providencia stuartii]TPW79076.1 his operon leader peptide [Providencia stuartii]HAU5734904.1 his operon leader peptide [Providencia stuartii]